MMDKTDQTKDRPVDGVIEVVIVDNHKIIREGIRSLLEKSERISVLDAVGYSDAARVVADSKPRIGLLNLVTNGSPEVLLTIHDILESSPETLILILADLANGRNLVRALKMGALGCLLRESGYDELIESICELSGGGAYLPPQISRRLLERMSNTNRDNGIIFLSPQQSKVLKLISRGYTNKEIAQMLVISKRTVEMHTYKLYKRLLVTNRTQAIQMAIKMGLIELEDIQENLYEALM